MALFHSGAVLNVSISCLQRLPGSLYKIDLYAVLKRGKGSLFLVPSGWD